MMVRLREHPLCIIMRWPIGPAFVPSRYRPVWGLIILFTSTTDDFRVSRFNTRDKFRLHFTDEFKVCIFQPNTYNLAP